MWSVSTGSEVESYNLMLSRFTFMSQIVHKHVFNMIFDHSCRDFAIINSNLINAPK